MMHNIVMVWLFNKGGLIVVSTDSLFIATFYLLLYSGRDLGNAFHPGSNLFHTLLAFPKFFFKKVDFEKISRQQKKTRGPEGPEALT